MRQDAECEPTGKCIHGVPKTISARDAQSSRDLRGSVYNFINSINEGYNMATYCIGDIQGCFDELEALLRIINYDCKNDHLWFVGDLVNRGPKSLEVLRFIKQLPNAKVVLGNHDLHLLNFYNKIVDFEVEHLEQILTAPDSLELIEWLRHQPLLYHDVKRNFVMTHAGIYPGWDLHEAVAYAREVEATLQGNNHIEFLKNLYGNEPSKWSNDLKGWDRLRFIINAFTRMRFCDLHGNLELVTSSKADTAPPGFLPWFKVPWRKTKNVQILFGHWAALNGEADEPNVFALDTGCVWGGSLTALRLDDGAKFSCSTLHPKK
ncbi:MAG: Bis(5'-nucleosyl)-tetraphosphatase (Symmetrical) [uncultured bacterium]|nr:MAG: Bis(5'-nucleosyl)-tetraphosphatase (Symmetrical) [uncultured bacterium]